MYRSEPQEPSRTRPGRLAKLARAFAWVGHEPCLQYSERGSLHRGLLGCDSEAIGGGGMLTAVGRTGAVGAVGGVGATLDVPHPRTSRQRTPLPIKEHPERLTAYPDARRE